MDIIPQEAHLLLQLEKCEEVIVWSSDPFVNRQFQDFSKLVIISSNDKTEDENVLGQIYEYYEKEKEQFSYILVLYGIDDEINCLKLLTVCLGIFKNAYIYGNQATVSMIQEFAQEMDSTIECFQLDQDSFRALFNSDTNQSHHQSLIQRTNFRRVYCSMQEYKGFYDMLATNMSIKDIYIGLQAKICTHLLDFRKDELKSRIKQSPLTKQQFKVQQNRILAEQFAEFHKETIEGNIQIIERFQKQMNEVKEYNTLLTNSKCSHLILKEFQFFETKKDQYQDYEEFEEDIDLFYQFYMENCPTYSNKKLIILEFLTKVLKDGAKEFIEKINQQSKYLPLPSQIANMNNAAIQEKEEYYENLMLQAQEQIEQLQKDVMSNRVNYEKNLEQLKDMSNLEIEELNEKIRLLETQTRKKDNVLRDSLNKYDKEKMILEQKIHFQDLEIMEMKKKIKSQFSFNQFLNENKCTQTDEKMVNTSQLYLNTNESQTNLDQFNRMMDQENASILNNNNSSRGNLSNKILNSSQEDRQGDAKQETTRLMMEIKQLTESISKKDAFLKNLQQQNNNLQNEIENMKEVPPTQNSQRNDLISSSSKKKLNTPYKEQQQHQQQIFSNSGSSGLRSQRNNSSSNRQKQNVEYDTEDIHQLVENFMDIDEDLGQIVEGGEVSAPQLSTSRHRQEKEKQSGLNSNGKLSSEKREKLEQYVQELNVFIESLKRDLSLQNEQIMSQQEEISFLKEQISMHELKQEEYEQIINQMNENEQNEQLIQECQNLNELIQQKTEEQSQCLNLLQQQSYELEINKKQINSYNIELQETTKRFAEQEERVKEKDEQLFQLFQMNQRYNNDSILIQQELQQSISERDELKGILDMCKNKIMQMEKLERQLTEQKQYIEQQDKAFYEQQEHFSTQVQNIQEEINARYQQELIDKEEQIMQLNNEIQQNLLIIQTLQNALSKQDGAEKSQLQQSSKIKTNYITSTHSSESHFNQNYLNQQNNLKLSDFQNNSHLDQSRNSARQSGYNQNQNYNFQQKDTKLNLKQSELQMDELQIIEENQQQQSYRNEQEEALLIQTLFESKNSINRKNQSLSKSNYMSNHNNNNHEEQDKEGIEDNEDDEEEEVLQEGDLISHRKMGSDKQNEDKCLSSTSRFSNLHSDILDVHSQNKVDQNGNNKLNNFRQENSAGGFKSVSSLSAKQKESSVSEFDSDQHQKHEFSIQKLCKPSSFENGRSHTEQSYSQLKQQGSANQKELSFQDNHDDLFISSNTFGNGVSANVYRSSQFNSDKQKGSEKVSPKTDFALLNHNNIKVGDRQNASSNKKDEPQEFLYSEGGEVDNSQQFLSYPLTPSQMVSSNANVQSLTNQYKLNQNNSRRDLLSNSQIQQELQSSQLKNLIQNNMINSSSGNSKKYLGANNISEVSASSFNLQQQDLHQVNPNNNNNNFNMNTINQDEKLQYKENIFNFIDQKSPTISGICSVPTSAKVKSFHNQPQAGQIVGQTSEQKLQYFKPIRLENTFNRTSSQNVLDIFQDCEKVKSHQKSESYHPSPIVNNTNANKNNNNHGGNQNRLAKVNSASSIINEFDLKGGSVICEVSSPSQNKTQKQQQLQSLVTNQQQITSPEGINKQNNINMLNSSNSYHNLSSTQNQQQQQQPHQSSQNVFKLGANDLFEDIFPSSAQVKTQGAREKQSKENTSTNSQQLFRKVSDKRKESSSLLQFENDLKVLEENILGASTINPNKNKLDINSIFSQKSENSQMNTSNNNNNFNSRKESSVLGMFDSLSKKDLFGKSYLNSGDSGLTSTKNQERKTSKFISGTNYSINSNSVQPVGQSGSTANRKNDSRFQFNFENISSNSQNNSNLNTSRNVTPLNDRKNSFFQSVLSINDDKSYNGLSSNNKSVNNLAAPYSPYSSVHSAFNKNIGTQPITREISHTTSVSNNPNNFQTSSNQQRGASNYLSVSPNTTKSFLKSNNISNHNNNNAIESNFSNKNNYQQQSAFNSLFKN